MKFFKILPLLIVFFSLQLQATVETRPTVLKRAINLINDRKFDEAVSLLESVLKNQEIKTQAPIYYLIGLAQYENENYASALSNLENALDISTDPKLDNKIDEYIEKTIKAQTFYEAAKIKNRFSYFLGAGYDSNILNLNKDNFSDVELSSITAIYGLNYSHKLIQNMDYSFVPELYLTDNYSLDTTFKATTTIQSSDALQWGVNLPVSLNVNWFSNFDQLVTTIGYKNIMLPIDDAKRSSAITTTSIGLKAVLGVSEFYSLIPQVAFYKDQSLITYTSSDDDQSASRIEMQIANQFITTELKHRIHFSVLGELNKADGKNASYSKYGSSLSVQLSFIESILFGPGLKYVETDYYDRTTARHDRNTNFSFDVTKMMTDDKSISMSLGKTVNNSSSDINSYQDLTVSFVFSNQYNF